MSEQKKKGQIFVLLDKLTLIGMAISFILILQPFWQHGFKVGFFSIIFFTIGQIIFSHLLPKDKS
ncbi:MAG: hypothetical protein HRT89_06815 [Lentisphaeria bacterium]|nr:hypothetical protein [Lentisphaeria bacterium]NQZ67765.1 hypothetical protein [Lentisphaeria bacterium]